MRKEIITVSAEQLEQRLDLLKADLKRTKVCVYTARHQQTRGYIQRSGSEGEEVTPGTVYVGTIGMRLEEWD